MLHISRTGPATWIDECARLYTQLAPTYISVSDGRVLRAPRAGESIFVDGQGNGYLFA